MIRLFNFEEYFLLTASPTMVQDLPVLKSNSEHGPFENSHSFTRLVPIGEDIAPTEMDKADVKSFSGAMERGFAAFSRRTTRKAFRRVCEPRG